MPPFPPTPLFLLGLLLAGVLLGALLAMCLRRVARRHAQRLRLAAERERAAAALHDTLLQSMQGMILRFQGVSHRLPPDSAERATIEAILDQADEVLADGRHRIMALRAPVVQGDSLRQAFAALGQSLQDSFDTPFRMVVAARPAPVDGEPGEEIYRIGREALYNAFQHAGASHIELELVYGCEFLTLYVRDDGRGMADIADAAALGGAGRHGLGGMRERAELLGAALEVRSLPERGTEVILKVPGALCYRARRHDGWRRRLLAWLGRSDTQG